MTQLHEGELRARLRTFYDELADFPPGIACAWPLGRLFNELLKQTKQARPEDPIVKSVSLLRDPGPDPDAAAVTHVGTVRAITAQLAAALDNNSATKA